MRILLKIESGPYQGRLLLLQPGQQVKVGRTEWADFAVPHDNHMSGVHFAVNCDQYECQLVDLDSTNGTQLNGASIRRVPLSHGDSIYAGRTSFSVQIEDAEPPPAPQKTQATPRPVIERESREAFDRPSADDLAAISPIRASRDSLAAAANVTTPDQPFPFSPAILLANESERPFAAALLDEDASVKREALWAAAWTGQKWLLEYCRHVASKPSADEWDALHLLALLGQPSDIDRILTVGRTAELGRRRFGLYAAHGHPRVIKDLLLGIESQDMNIAVACGVAFTQLTGAEIDSPDVVEVHVEEDGPRDDVQEEFVEPVTRPSPERAYAFWEDVSEIYQQGLRWRCGIDLATTSLASVKGQLTMQAQWMECLRAHHEKNWQGPRTPPYLLLP